jgi:hypothetical protein
MVWMMVETKARAPQLDSTKLEFLRASGDAYTQGLVPLGLISQAQIRVTSPMKTVADCFKYADRVGDELGPAALAAEKNLYNRQRLLASPRSAASNRPSLSPRRPGASHPRPSRPKTRSRCPFDAGSGIATP